MEWVLVRVDVDVDVEVEVVVICLFFSLTLFGAASVSDSLAKKDKAMTEMDSNIAISKQKDVDGCNTMYVVLTGWKTGRKNTRK